MQKFVVPHYDDPTGPPYLIRWRIFQTPWAGVYLHRLGTPDPRDTLHNHPWTFVSFVLRGGYDEQNRSDDDVIPGVDCLYSRRKVVKFVNVKRLRDWHWIENLHRTPTWTLMFVGRRRRVWGYLDRDGVYQDFDVHPFNDEFMRAINLQGDAA